MTRPLHATITKTAADAADAADAAGSGVERRRDAEHLLNRHPSGGYGWIQRPKAAHHTICRPGRVA